MLKTNTLKLAVVLAVSAVSSVQAMSYVNAAGSYVAGSLVGRNAINAASFVATKAKAAGSYVAGSFVGRNAINAASFAGTKAKNAAMWSMARHANGCELINRGLDLVSFGRYAGFALGHSKKAKVAATAIMAGATYAGYRLAKWSYNKAVQMIAARKKAQHASLVVKAEQPATKAVTVSSQSVSFASLSEAQKAAVMNEVNHRLFVNTHIKAGSAYVGQLPFANVTPNAVAAEFFSGKVALAA